MAKTIALLTDFGVEDVYVGVMKGVMQKICPDAAFIDITHAIPAQDVQGGAFALRDSYHYFPEGTVFLVVVDPGVGSTRRPVVVKAGDYGFIAPDNGVLSYVLADFEAYHAAELAHHAYQLPAMSSTFHGRDVFAPGAAHLANGVALADFGPLIEDLLTLPLPLLMLQPGQVVGEVIRIDHFGNIITSIGRLLWQDEQNLLLSPMSSEMEAITIVAMSAVVEVGELRLKGIQHAYHEVPVGDLLVQVDSVGQLEIAVNQGNAAKRLNVKVGDHISVKLG
ncbi:SAM-dependent chlorinase/fluorinase [Phototrophicus methaneseepsis]|uniref:SAM-dependent chlorinase/fluorinase n=1 Tax=Phototrophicus methaneseepsis TaxID=2710758 RepID=A0A7S8E5V6_9CHLR|nr:SAM-dependent chlorinase/fluorinase [Phototrophicus methaneseepsis]QPC80958.1 SAM-dependent chlorinase/fluorinase [Phototrophicus methaneseepsis]